MEKISVLFRGWFLQHSYGIVNCFQLVHLYKKYNKNIEFYVQEMPYFREEWNKNKKLVYNESYNNIITNFKVWNGEPIDIVYSITYPYDITEIIVNNKNIPKCVFYTSEFSWLDKGYFTRNGKQFDDDDAIREYLLKHEEIYFTTPSEWSAQGIKKYNVVNNKNRIITHGVDTDIFKLHEDKSTRNNLRKFYKVKDNEILMINIGAMTQNKGIMLILQAMNILVNMNGYKEYKLLLKGTGDLYTSKQFLENYFEQLRANNVLTKEQMENLLTNHIIFSDKTLSYESVNDLFNASDLYISPYLAEGFNLTVLESLSAGLPVLVPETGSTKQYIDDIKANNGSDYVIHVKSNVIKFDNGMMQNNIDLINLLEILVNKREYINLMKTKRYENYNALKTYINNDYSWEHVADLLYGYLNEIKNKRKNA
jgi:glycosyltransferase involved in cell wall biosynthesis